VKHRSPQAGREHHVTAALEEAGTTAESLKLAAQRFTRGAARLSCSAA
jgi:hypothetical protein